MLKKVLFTLLGLGISLPIVAVLVFAKLAQFQAMGANAANMVMPPSPVTTAEVRAETLHPRVSSVGSVVAVQGVAVSAEAEGVVREIAFKAGALVESGEGLVVLDTEVEEAELRAAEATAELSRLVLARTEGLFKQRTLSQSELDEARAAAKQAEARVDNIRALIDKKSVRAPFAGRLGIRQISVGQFLTKGAPVVSLQSLDPVYVEFSLPQQRLGDLAEGLSVEIRANAFAGAPFTGEVTAVNPDVDPATRNVRVQATLQNPDGRLRPGMFVEVDLVLERSEDVLLIPATAVLYAPYGDSVFVVEDGEAGPDGRKPLVARQRPVRLGAGVGDFIVVTEGLKAGERIASTGVFKLRPGMPVVIDNTLAPDAQLAPKPRNT